MIVAPALYESAAVLVVDKPAGVAVIPGREGPSGDSLHERLQTARGERLWVVHRLDRDTSGALVFARTAAAHRALSMAFEAGDVRKRYHALCEGLLREPMTVDVALVPARRGRMRPAAEGEEGKAARTDVRPLELFPTAAVPGGITASLVEATPLTGRTHQIRVHLRSRGHPLLVDHQYGRKEPFPPPVAVPAHAPAHAHAEPLLSRTPLHAARLAWSGLSAQGVEDLDVEAPLPADMQAAVAWLRKQSHAAPPSGAAAD